MADKIKVCEITPGNITFYDTTTTDIRSDIDDNQYEAQLINADRKIYVAYRSEFYTPVDMYDWQVVYKTDKNNDFVSLSDDDVKWLEKYAWNIYQVYCWQTCETMLKFISWNAKPDFVATSDDSNIAEIEKGYEVIYSRYKGK